MNTFLLAAVAIGLVAFLVIKRRRESGSAAAPATPRARTASRVRGRRGAERIQGYPEATAEPVAAAAETAASTLSPVLEPLPVASAPAPVAPLQTAVPADWGFDEMIVEPGWPMPGEMAAAWPGDGAVAPAPAPAPAPPAFFFDAEDGRRYHSNGGAVRRCDLETGLVAVPVFL